MRGWIASGVLLVACSSSSDEHATAPSEVVADLRADTNRDGDVRFDATDQDKTTWSATNGAVFLANIDDDSGRCPKEGDDAVIAGCNDASDDVVDGEDDALDLARLLTRPWPAATAEATGAITISPSVAPVRLFKRTGSGAADFVALRAGDGLTRAELVAGVELGIEATDIVRDPAVWDGFVTVTLSITTKEKTYGDEVRLRVSPVMTSHHLLPPERIWITDDGDAPNALTRRDVTAACADAGAPAPTSLEVDDPWAQDFFETGYMSMPSKDGQHVMRVNYRSANVFQPGDAKNPLRAAGKVVFSTMRGKDVAGIQQFDPKHAREMDSLDSFGNLETVPPYSANGQTYPLGRVLRGKTASFFPDPTFVKMVEAQGMQPPIYIDTSWLFVGHVDETLSFVKAASPRGWALLVSDAALAKKMLEDQVAAGNGAVQMFVGENWYDDRGVATPAAISISGALADTEVMTASATAAVEVAAQIDVLKKETGLGDEEIIHIPFLHTRYGGRSIAFQPGMVNGLYVSDGHFVAPDPHGPVVNGKDIFRDAMTTALAPLGITVDFAEDWAEYHAALGEVHCGTNTTRKVPDVKWWETGR